MKKIFTYIGIAALATAIISSCGKDNVPAVFDDSNAFVAFNSTSVNIDEDSADTLRIPVTLASVAGLGERISYTVKDSTAKQGVNFSLVDASATLTFSDKERVQYIEIVPKYDGVYTGDLVFIIELNASANVDLGNSSVCTVKVNDVDHPLTPILGTWKMSANSYFNGDQEFEVTFIKDSSDDHMVWIDNLFGNDSWKGDDMLYYGNVSDDLTSIVIPLGQESEYTRSDGSHIVLYSLSADMYLYNTGSVTATVTFGEKTTISFGKDYGFAFRVGTANSYINLLLPEITGVKK